MIEMNFKVADLLNTLTKNRDTHATNAEKMRSDYKKAFRALLQKKIDRLDAGEQVSQNISLSEPFDYLSSYDDVISMLAMTTDEHISLTEDQYKCYARDNWPNKNRFASVMSSYSSHL